MSLSYSNRLIEVACWLIALLQVSDYPGGLAVISSGYSRLVCSLLVILCVLSLLNHFVLQLMLRTLTKQLYSRSEEGSSQCQNVENKF